MSTKKRLFLIDGSALAYRSYFAFIRNPLINSKGENTSVPFGFTNSMMKILREENPDYIIMVFDTKAPTFRHEIFKEYKSTRAKMPQEMESQLPRIREIIDAMNIPVVEKDGFEADDLMGTIAKHAKKKGMEVVLVTGDKDFMQLVDEDVKILNPRRSGEQIELLDRRNVKEKFGVPPDKVTDVMGLMGDSSDNVPGVPGIGEKTAKELIQKFGSLEQVLANAEKVKRKNVRNSLKEHADIARLSKKLVTIDVNVPYKFDLQDFETKEFNLPRLKELFKELEFSAFLKDITPEQVKEEVSYKVVRNQKEFSELLEKLKRKGEFCLDTETTSLSPIDAELVGVSFSYKKGEAFYLPVGHHDKQCKNLKLDLVIEGLKDLLEDEKIKKIGQNLKFDLEVLSQYGIDLKGISFDTMIASYVSNPSEYQHNLDYMALKFLDHRMIPITDLIGSGKKQKSFTEVPLMDATVYSCEDADFTLRLKEIFQPRLKELKLEKLFYEVEIPLIGVLAEMELNGVCIDVDYLKEMSDSMQGELEKLEKEIFSLAGKEFNVNSSQQLSRVLFEDLKLPPVKKTEKKTALSTDWEVLETLSKIHPLPRILLDYRQLSKLKSTYVDALPALVSPKTKRIHTSFNQTVTATGRLSSSDPNLQNIPIRTEMGKKIRKAFIPTTDDFIILSSDYSQIEPRILAHFSEDETLTNSFLKGEDIHRRTASEVFGVPLSEVTDEQRRLAKTTNFSIMYGVSAYGLSQSTDMTPQEAAAFIEVYFKRYPKVKEYLDSSIEQAKELGYAVTLLGRRRYIPEINSSNRQKREFAERVAINTPIQGTAADLIKVAMIEIAKEFKMKKVKSKMILQVHDELVFEVHRDELDWVKEMVKDKMENTIKLKVPVKVDMKIGTNWLEAS
ncbi:MAG: DNA polymerase I [Candidatus Zixiibacteriota bacterium]